MPTKLLAVVMTVFILSACHKEHTPQLTESSPKQLNTAGRAANTQVPVATPGYIIRTPNNSSATLSAIRSRLTQIGARETGQLAALNMLFVTSTSTDFVGAMAGLNVKIGSNLRMLTPNVNSRQQLAGDNPPSSGDNNSFFFLQWGMDAIDAPQAWNAGYRGAGVKVAVLDVGVYLDHPDLAGNLLPAQGHNFVNMEEVYPGGCTDYPECDPSDPGFKSTGFSHGTHTSGIIAAVDNTIGVIGVAPDAKIIPVKCLSDYFGFGFTSWIASAIVYAADQKVDVINMSLGGIDLKGQGPGSNLVQEGIKAYKDAIQYAYSKGVTVVCAAGNAAIDFDHSGSLVNLPGGSPHAIAVSATSPYGFAYDPAGNLDIPASYTNYGSSYIDFAAPGGDFDHPGDLWFFDMVLSTGGPDDYYFAAGTSMASPHAAGVAALIIGKYGHGMLSPSQVKTKMKAGADDLGKRGNDPWFGAGRVNAFKSVR